MPPRQTPGAGYGVTVTVMFSYVKSEPSLATARRT